MKKLTLFVFLLLALTPLHIQHNTFVSTVAFADEEGGNPGGTGSEGGNPGDTGSEGGNIPTIVNPIGPDSIQELLAVILSAIVQIAIPFLVLAVMWVGFLFVAARGNPEKLGKAKQALFFTLIGALIILGAQTLAVVLSGTIRQLTE